MASVEVRNHKKEDAVSPVVGVMLMLVVTIVIAAVVAMFATGVFSETKAASTAVIELDGDADVCGDSTNGYWLSGLTFAHKGGDVLNLNELALKVTYNGSTTTTTPFGSSGTWSVGEKQELTVDSSPGFSGIGTTPTYFTWSITDGSGLVIASGTKHVYIEEPVAENEHLYVCISEESVWNLHSVVIGEHTITNFNTVTDIGAATSTIIVNYSDSQPTPDASGPSARYYSESEEQWTWLTNCVIDSINKTLTIPLTQEIIDDLGRDVEEAEGANLHVRFTGAE